MRGVSRRPRGELRIIGGEWRSRRIRFAQDLVRPTPDRVRQTTFDWLAPQIRGARVLDLCAGSGAMGLEALSRGARQAVFIDSAREPVQAIRQALEVLDGAERAQVILQDAVSWLAATSASDNKDLASFDIAFVDPPYAADLWKRLLPALRPWMRSEHRIYIEWLRTEEPDFGVPLTWHRTNNAAQVSYGLASFTQDVQDPS